MRCVSSLCLTCLRHRMFPTRVRFFEASQRRNFWWSRALEKLDGAKRTPDAPMRASLLPDAVIDACVPRRPASHVAFGADTLLPPDTFASLLLRIPSAPMWLGECGKETNAQRRSPPGGGLTITNVAGEASQPQAYCTIGTLYDALVDGQSRSLISPPSLEVFFVRLASFAPLFLRLTPASHACSGAHQDSAGTLVEYCAGMTTALNGTLHPFMRRLIREVRVSWQPWLSSLKIARAIAAATGVDGDTADKCDARELPLQSFMRNFIEPSLGRLRCLSSEGGRVSRREGKCHHACMSQYAATDEKAWQPLLEHVPPFFVATVRVQASLRRAFSDDKALRLLDTWTSQRHFHMTSPVDTVSDDGCGNRPRLHGEGSRCHGPYVEVSPCGTAIRAPSSEQCLQAGCPSWLIYNPQYAPTTLYEKYALLHADHDSGPGLMHAALALVCAVVPSTLQPLSVVRQIFSNHQQQQCSIHQREQRYLGETIEAADEPDSAPAAARRVCASLFPCLEALLDHPQLAFAVQVIDKSTGSVCVRFPAPNATGGMAADLSTRLQEFRVHLHPSFSHAQRGRADVALSLLEKVRHMSVPAAVPKPQHRHVVPFDISHVWTVRFHDARDGVLTDSLSALLQLLEKQSATMLAGGSALDAGNFAFVGVSEVLGLTEESPTRWDALTTVHEPRYPQESPRIVLLLTVVSNGSSSMDVVAVDGRQLCLQMWTMTSDATITAADEEQAEATKEGLLPFVARVLSSSSVVKVVRSSVFADGSVCFAHRLLQRDPSAVRGLLDSLCSEALTSVCSLEHIVHYVGYPIDDAMSLTLTSEADLLLASTILARYGSAIDTTTTWEKSSTDGEAGGSAPEQSTRACAINEAATISLAASLLLQHHAQEHLLHILENADHKDSSESATKSTLGLTLSCALHRWARKPTLARQHGLTLRLKRFQWWLAHATSGKMDGLSACSWVSSDTEARYLSMTSAARKRCLGDPEMSLRELACRFGPEPLPSPYWVRGMQTAHVPKATSAFGDTGLAMVKENEGGIVKAMQSDSEKGSSLPFSAEGSAVDEHVDTDALIHDALVQDAAAVLQNVTRHASHTNVADSDSSTRTLLHDHTGLPLCKVEASEDTACTPPSLSSCSPRSAASATPSACFPAEEDALKSYLSTLFDDLPTKPTSSTSLQTPNLATESSASTSSAPRSAKVITGAEHVEVSNVVPSLQLSTTASGGADLCDEHLLAAHPSHTAACGSRYSGRDDPSTTTVPVSITCALPMGFLYGPPPLITSSKSSTTPRLASTKRGAYKLSHAVNFPLPPGLHATHEGPREGLPLPPNQPTSTMGPPKSASSSPNPPLTVPTTCYSPSHDANFAPLARFDRFAAWKQPATRTSNQQAPSPCPPPQPPLSSPCAMSSTCEKDSAKPPRSASVSSVVPTRRSLEALFSFEPTEAERLRLGSLLIDILRGTIKQPPSSRRQ
ncbi:hypothetical protein, unknown function [Leishmania tarentolae]|uniref:Uncharacterized protein n=1 Tax=Leishmania tarentolae TaxID=5689 RepID=A0A640KXT9_LEITA|nr:hypothetical protein, unknown function [Leishmania tarentolae]